MRHFITILPARESGMELLHMPYKGGSAAMQSVAAGDIAAALATEAAARPFHETGADTIARGRAAGWRQTGSVR